MENVWSFNISTGDRIIRLIVGSLLILGVMFLWTKPAMALVAIYPINTAIIKWDPFYAIFYAVRDCWRKANVFQHFSAGMFYRQKKS